MTEFTIKIASRVVAVSAMFDSTRDYCTAYLWEGEPVCSIAISQQDIDFEREKSAREAALEGLPVRAYSDTYLELTAVQRKIADKLFAYDILLFHGSVVAVDGEAYLFTAKSGTGKSTHTRLWRELLGERAVMVNDDKPFLQITHDGVFVHGSPWNGKHKLGTNICVPLKAICILERGEENRIQAVSPKEVLPMLLQQSQRPQKPQKYPKYMDLIDGLAGKVAFYKLSCNMDPEAAVIAYEGMSSKRLER